MLPFSLMLLSAGAAPPTNVTAYVTWYGAKDNCPPGGAIAFPTKHQEAGGVGTWNDPVTFAGVRAREAPGTRIYVAAHRKYFIMEDSCEECEHQWKSKKKYHVDLWMGPSSASPGPGLIACENQLTVNALAVLTNPPQGLPVDTTKIYDPMRPRNMGCIAPAQVCHDHGSQCGNQCEIPKAATCTELAALFALNITRFEALNPGLSCTSGTKVAKGKSVCMGGSCGD